jgi:hypothetical protein
VASGSLFAFLLLFALDLMGQAANNPYLGILTYIVAPGFLILGLALIVVGAWVQRRQQKAQPDRPLHHLAIDLSRPRDRRTLSWFVLGTMTFLLLTAIGSYQTYVYTESNQFCGEVCHAVMGPEFSVYHRSPHARVACVECHVGSGAANFVLAKVNGVHQLADVVTNRIPRPIATPVHNLRPARDTCEQCHWPEKYTGSIERVFNHYMPDDGNTAYSVRMLVHVGGGSSATGPVTGIHWHVSSGNKVEYFASDEQRQVIPWIRVTDPKGNVTVYRTGDFKGEPDPAQIRTMDCIDCHNRPSHRYLSPNEAVDEAMYAGDIDPKLPAIRRTAVELLTKDYPTQAAAAAALEAGLAQHYGSAPGLGRAVAAVQTIYRDNIFPEMKVDWSKHPDNIGHLNAPGCFRCHDDKHAAVGDGHKMLATDCATCHTILTQGSGIALNKLVPTGEAFVHPSGDIGGLGLICSDCHNGKIQEN